MKKSQKQQLEAMSEARKRWGAFCILGPTDPPPLTYWVDSIGVSYKLIERAAARSRATAAKIRNRTVEKMDKELFGKKLEP